MPLKVQGVSTHKIGEGKWEVRGGPTADGVLLGTIENNGVPPFFFRAASARSDDAVLTKQDLREIARIIEQENIAAASK